MQPGRCARWAPYVNTESSLSILATHPWVNSPTTRENHPLDIEQNTVTPHFTIKASAVITVSLPQ